MKRRHQKDTLKGDTKIKHRKEDTKTKEAFQKETLN